MQKLATSIDDLNQFFSINTLVIFLKKQIDYVKFIVL